MMNELIINKWRSQSNWFILCGDICDNQYCHYYTYPCIEIRVVFRERHIVYRSMEQHMLFDGYIKTNLNCARVSISLISKLPSHPCGGLGLGWELFRIELQQNYRHQSKIAGLRSTLSQIKSSTNHTFCSMKCRFYTGTLVCDALQHICQELG